MRVLLDEQLPVDLAAPLQGHVDYVKNPDYFVKGRLHLDALRYVVIKERGTRTAALQAGQLDMKPPFDNQKVRLAVSHAIDRRALIQSVHQGGGVVGAGMAAKPYGVWGLLEKDLLALPGYGKPADMKARAKALMAEAGITPQHPLKVEIVTRAIAVYADMASFVINELKQIGIEGTLRQVETAQWHPMARFSGPWASRTRGQLPSARGHQMEGSASEPMEGASSDVLKEESESSGREA